MANLKLKFQYFMVVATKFRSDTERKYGVNLALNFMRRRAC